MMISVKTFMHQIQTLAKISGPEIIFAETHTRAPPSPPNPPLEFRKCGVGEGKWGGGHMAATCPKISTWTHNSWDFTKIIILSLDSERAGSRTLEKFSRQDRERDCAKFERSRRFRDSNMNPKKKSRRYRVSVSIQALDLAISRFTHSLDCNLGLVGIHPSK